MNYAIINEDSLFMWSIGTWGSWHGAVLFTLEQAKAITDTFPKLKSINWTKQYKDIGKEIKEKKEQQFIASIRKKFISETEKLVLASGGIYSDDYTIWLEKLLIKYNNYINTVER